ncbi:MAG: hypothetical protein PHS57_07845 [Alphaproteobacteria bacterium]|nr:hypothetical protein [Alphaproteobacteria bacterium]
MNEKTFYKLTLALSVLALVILVINISLSSGLRSKQEDLALRRATIASGVQLSQLGQNLVRSIAETSIKNNDADLRALLMSQGITVKKEDAPEKTKKSAK